MYQNKYSVVILGAGPIGSLFAIMLSKKCKKLEKILLISKKFTYDDKRILALNYGSVQTLNQFNVFPNIHSHIKNVHISYKNHLGRVLINNTDFQIPFLGSVISYKDLCNSLHKSLLNSKINIIYEDNVSIIEQNEKHVIINVNNKNIYSELLIKANGINVNENCISINDICREYNQYALITEIKSSYNKRYWAWERFTQLGPIAILPHPYKNGHFSVILCTSKNYSAYLLNLNKYDFSTTLNEIFGSRLGRLEVIDDKHIFPLYLKIKKNIIDGRIISIGNAAQTLHPIAGQGLNLGIRDVVYLVKYITPWLNEQEEFYNMALNIFNEKRKCDRNLTIKTTDILSKIFLNTDNFSQISLSFGMIMMSMITPISYPLSNHMVYGFRK
ncbi:2-octaprenyl-6-methoxyphenol hydroxylase [Candidatus Kinetoplastibacterium sorsogonicusi]|uniref:2-octaprenyl-6-methoxyphenol hydroxylase n=1 Tax=Candidatus Kinetoplastidibacterium kentomonadis TaxID=1576550 RepID=A0A3Q8ERL4_9PROT|nr:FAD-dependent monooxygenase [Candidatus Kinetoplastibacterium sorsogonicusi]AWD32626.1 2-octaprenyl-6-methoxyphenol hydroxylase [Candidatus Kinetoplastibacterium sorsogonicusi]